MEGREESPVRAKSKQEMDCVEFCIPVDMGSHWSDVFHNLHFTKLSS